MVPTAWIYSIQFKFWTPQPHQHLCLHSTCHLNKKNLSTNSRFALTPISTLVHPVLVTEFTRPLQQMSSSLWTCTLYTTTFPMYPLLTTGTLYWIITNASTTDTTKTFDQYCKLLNSLCYQVQKCWHVMPVFSCMALLTFQQALAKLNLVQINQDYYF